MRRKILFGIILVALISSLLGAGIYAYFSDTAKSIDNTFTAGTFDLMLSHDEISWTDDVSATWTPPYDWAPGNSIEETLYIKNTGTLKIVTIKIKPTDLVDVDGLAGAITITEFTVAKPGKVMSHMESWMEGVFGDGDGTFTLEEFANSPYWFYTGEEDGAIDSGDTGYVKFAFLFNPEAGSDEYEGVTCSFDLTINAIQGPADYTVIGDCGYGYA